MNNDKTDSGNPFLPTPNLSYANLLDKLSAENLREGLLAYGLFGEKLPPIFSSVSFANYFFSKRDLPQDKQCGWIKYRYRRNVGSFREFGIPNPYQYGLLVKHLSEYWDYLKFYFQWQTLGHPYRISRIHIRKIAGKKAIFEMNYKRKWLDPDPAAALSVDKEYLVECDISQCFPSVYTHALDWALIGKTNAKKNNHGQICKWSHELDHYAQNIKNGETHGLLIGLHASNLLAEIILVRIDKHLHDAGFDFVRYIDDYKCYAKNFEQAEYFSIQLDKFLSDYGLRLNQKKTKISKLPQGDQEKWVQALSNFRFSNHPLSKNDVQGLLNMAISCVKEYNNAAALNYALSMLSKQEINNNARQYLGDVGSSLLYLFPYLLPYADDYIFNKAGMGSDQIAYLAERIFHKALKTRDYLSACYALFFAIKYQFVIDQIDYENIYTSEDCLLYLFMWLYASHKQLSDVKFKLHEMAIDLYRNSSMDQYWLFIYEVIGLNDFDRSDGQWRELKKKGVSFIDTDCLLPPHISQSDGSSST